MFELQGGHGGTGRRTRRLLSSVTAAVVAVPTTLLLAAGPAQAATATISGGYTAGGVTYAKQGDSLTVSVATRVNNGGNTTANCVAFLDVTNASSPVTLGSVYNTLPRHPATWSFTFNAPAGSDGLRTVRATPYTVANVSGSGSSAANVCDLSTKDGQDSADTEDYRLDNTAPTIIGSHAPASGTPAAQNGWYRGDVLVHWTCSGDNGSGVKAPGCPADQTVTGEGVNLSRTGTVSDNVGNTSSATVSDIKIDRTAPTTTADAPSGWQTTGVTVRLSASDSLSTVAKTEYSLDSGAWTTGTSVALGEGRHTLEYRSTDLAGNVEATKQATVDIDLTAPTITSSQDPARPESGWNKSDVTVSFTCADNLSGVQSCTSPSMVTDEGTTTKTGVALDYAGLSNSVQHSVSIDKTAPSISGAASGTKGLEGWFTSDVTVSFTCSDPGSDAAPQTGSGVASCPGSSTLGEGAGQSVSGTAADAAGNTSSATVGGVKVDKTAPTTTTVAPSGWQNADVTLDFAAADQEGLSGVAYTESSQDDGETWAPGDSLTLGEGVHTVLYRSVDVAGNVEQQHDVTVQVDETAPTIAGAPDRDPVDGWYNGDVTVTFTCADEGGSGLDGTCPEPVMLGEGDGQSVTGSVSDVAGNTASAHVGPIRVDKTAPTTTADSPTGWQKDNVTVTLSASDNLSGVTKTEYSLDNGDSWTAGTTVELAEGEHTLKYRSTDLAGNVEATKTAQVDIDLTAPTITSSQNPAKNGAGWNNTAVTVHFTCGDALSGPATCTGDTPVSDEGTTTVHGEAADNAGNVNSMDHTVWIDKTAPTIEGSKVGTEGANGWYTSDVAVSFTCNDDRSGVAGCTGNTVLDTEGAGQSVTGNATDAADNTASATVGAVSIDKNAPTTTSDAPTGWQTKAVTVSFTADDQEGLSGVDYTEYSVDGGAWAKGGSVTLGDGTHTLQYRSADNAGNVEDAKSTTVQVDLTGPAVTLDGPASTSASSATVSGTATDAGSGLVGVTVNGQPVTVASDGTFSQSVELTCGDNTVTAVATDGVGLTRSAEATVTRTCVVVQPTPVWSSQGFFAPVGMSSSANKMVNTVKGGSTVPLKFRVYKDGVEQKDVSVVTGLKVTTVICETGALTDTVAQLTSGSTSLRYDGSQFVQNWKTPTAVGCYRASALLGDGSAITADFRIQK
ncbi:MAG TPA: PxKF domain-containing protein [Nocardioidaceae bacterium]